MASNVARTKLVPTIRSRAITVDGRSVLIEARGPGVSRLEQYRAERNRERWNKGLRPNRFGIWR